MDFFNGLLAVEWLNEGVRKGEIECYARLAVFYAEKGHQQNAGKSWASYRKNCQNTHDNAVLCHCFDYLAAAANARIAVADIGQFMGHRAEIMRYAMQMLERLKNRSAPIGFFKANMWLVRHALYPDKPPVRSRGEVAWWDEKDQIGFVTDIKGTRLCLMLHQVVEGEGTPAPGREVEFVPVNGEQGPLACVVKLL